MLLGLYMQIESTFTMCFVLSVKPINVSMIVRLGCCAILCTNVLIEKRKVR